MIRSSAHGNCRHTIRLNLYEGTCHCTRCGETFGLFSLEYWWAVLLRLMHLR